MNEYIKELRKKFERLTPAQHRLMAFSCASTAGSSQSIGKALLKLELVEKIERRVGGRAQIDYEVPVPIHMVYCNWCAEQESEESARPA